MRLLARIFGLDNADVKSLKMAHRTYTILLAEEDMDKRLKNVSKKESGIANQSLFAVKTESTIMNNEQVMKIKNLSVEINNQIKDYYERIKVEEESTFWVNDDSIILWKDKIAVLTAADILLTDLTGQVDPFLLKRLEENHKGWSDGTVTKDLVKE